MLHSNSINQGSSHGVTEGLRLDLLVEELIVVELKSLESLQKVNKKQVLTYLKLLNLPIGLLINFGGETVREGVSRILNSKEYNLRSSV